MASLLPGYEYDLFISYRHNDNRSGWVTEFVKALQEELASTIKDSVSVYFDTNPHDGLLETDHVDKSLEGKLKCLIFIPIISQTYCDPKSFAWKHEFCVFNKLVKEEQSGRDIRLSNGNVTSRILPVKIHDIEAADQAIIEAEIDGALRAIEFIYKEPGVNRPLRINDNRNVNLSKTDYTNQVNKLARAIKEIIQSIRHESREPVSTAVMGNPRNKTRKIILVSALVLLVISVVAFFILPVKLSKILYDTDGGQSIAVLPFVDMSSEQNQEYFSDGISEELINALAEIPSLKVSGRTSSFAFKGTKTDLKEIGNQLQVKTLLEGSVRKSGNSLRITAQLINAENGFHIWSDTYERELTDIFKVQDEITNSIMQALNVYLLGTPAKETREGTPSMEAYDLYLKARQLVALRGQSLLEARALFEKAISLDPAFASAYSGLGKTLALYSPYSLNRNSEMAREVRTLADKMARAALALDPQNAEAYMVLGFIAATNDWDFDASRTYFQKALEIAPNSAEIANFFGDYYLITLDKDHCIELEKRAVQLDPKLGINHANLVFAYMTFNEYEKAILAGKLAGTIGLVGRNASWELALTYLAVHQVDKADSVMAYPLRQKNIHYQIQRAISLNDRKAALTYLNENSRQFAPARLAESYLQLGMYDSASKWIEKAYEVRDGLLVYYSFIKLPEDYPDNAGLKKAFNKPELNALFEIRRKNRKLYESDKHQP